MPEGPECRKVAESLAKFISNKKLVEVKLLSGRYIKKNPGGFESFYQDLPASIAGVGVHGKFIYWILNKEYSLWITLGMTGSWGAVERKHSRVKFSFEDGTVVYFNDQRNFGTLKFVRGKHQLIEKLNSLGPDMLSEEVSAQTFISKVRKKNNHNICKVLMDQSVICGVGNYVKADSLWLAKINPHLNVSEINDNDLSILNECIQKVLKESYDSGGATIKTYENFDGEKGEYAERFLVYNRKTDLDGNKVIMEHTTDGRTTHWSPKRQNGENNVE
jgi:formamidopyrimidine-DNA glycosylase